MILNQIIEEELSAFHTQFDTWEEAVRASCEALKQAGYINKQYEDAIVENIYEFGPYIVLLPGIAMPHSTQGGEGVFKTGIGFMKVEAPVYFDDDQSIYAHLFFTLAAENADKHLENIQDLMELLMDDGIVDKLMKSKSKDDLAQIAKEYQI